MCYKSIEPKNAMIIYGDEGDGVFAMWQACGFDFYENMGSEGKVLPNVTILLLCQS